MSHPARVCGLKNISMDYQCRCTPVTYRQELVGEADAQIDFLFESVDNIPSKRVEGHRVMGQPPANSNSINAQKKPLQLIL